MSKIVFTSLHYFTPKKSGHCLSTLVFEIHLKSLLKSIYNAFIYNNLHHFPGWGPFVSGGAPYDDQSVSWVIGVINKIMYTMYTKVQGSLPDHLNASSPPDQ